MEVGGGLLCTLAPAANMKGRAVAGTRQTPDLTKVVWPQNPSAPHCPALPACREWGGYWGRVKPNYIEQGTLLLTP